jgi:hypothetical protein
VSFSVARLPQPAQAAVARRLAVRGAEAGPGAGFVRDPRAVFASAALLSLAGKLVREDPAPGDAGADARSAAEAVRAVAAHMAALAPSVEEIAGAAAAHPELAMRVLLASASAAAGGKEANGAWLVAAVARLGLVAGERARVAAAAALLCSADPAGAAVMLRGLADAWRGATPALLAATAAARVGVDVAVGAGAAARIDRAVASLLAWADAGPPGAIDADLAVLYDALVAALPYVAPARRASLLRVLSARSVASPWAPSSAFVYVLAGALHRLLVRDGRDAASAVALLPVIDYAAACLRAAPRECYSRFVDAFLDVAWSAAADGLLRAPAAAGTSAGPAALAAELYFGRDRVPPPYALSLPTPWFVEGAAPPASARPEQCARPPTSALDENRARVVTVSGAAASAGPRRGPMPPLPPPPPAKRAAVAATESPGVVALCTAVWLRVVEEGAAGDEHGARLGSALALVFQRLRPTAAFPAAAAYARGLPVLSTAPADEFCVRAALQNPAMMELLARIARPALLSAAPDVYPILRSLLASLVGLFHAARGRLPPASLIPPTRQVLRALAGFEMLPADVAASVSGWIQRLPAAEVSRVLHLVFDGTIAEESSGDASAPSGDLLRRRLTGVVLKNLEHLDSSEVMFWLRIP